MRNSKVILLCAGQGGHEAQLLRFLRLLSKYRSACASSVLEVVSLLESHKKSRSDNQFLRLYTRVSFYSKYPTFLRRFILIFALFKVFFISLFYLQKNKVGTVVLFGPLFSIPTYYAAKVLRLKVLFIEDWCRFETPTKTGEFLYRRGVITFYQNKSLATFYPRGVFCGRL